jgi:heme oxygenase
VKDLEMFGHDEKQEGNIDEVGTRQVIVEIIKTHKDIIGAFNGYLKCYLSQDVTSESYLSLCRVAKFIYEAINTRQREEA